MKGTVLIGEIREQPDDELGRRAVRLRADQFRLRMHRQTSQVENAMEPRHKRRELARVLTVLRARALGLEAMGAAGAQPALAPKRESREPLKPVGAEEAATAAQGDDGEDEAVAARRPARKAAKKAAPKAATRTGKKKAAAKKSPPKRK